MIIIAERRKNRRQKNWTRFYATSNNLLFTSSSEQISCVGDGDAQRLSLVRGVDELDRVGHPEVPERDLLLLTHR